MAVTRSSVDWPTLGKRGGVTLVLSLLINYVLLTVVLQLELVASYEHLAYPPVTIWTTVGVIGATVVYGLLHRWSETPDRTFVRVAIVVLLLSFIPDGALLAFDEAATVGAATILAVLHIPPAAVCIVTLTGQLSE